MDLSNYQNIFSNFLSEKLSKKKSPDNLYLPIFYLLKMGGKRLRPILSLMTADIFGNQPKEALHAAAAVEMFHNFTLMHDDIMDDADLRRGKKTVHKKWNHNTAILSGDAMMIWAYQLLEAYKPSIYCSTAQLLSETAIKVCEGQSYDMSFEMEPNISYPEYIKMIGYKTAILVAASMQMGAMVVCASPSNQKIIYDFGYLLGLAFQLQDDYLDCFGDEESFGKSIGGDIINNKKTILYIKSLETLKPKKAAELMSLYSKSTTNSEEKILQVNSLFKEAQVAKSTKHEIETYTKKALKALEQLSIETSKIDFLIGFASDLMSRKI